jgi:hypothetical protein
MLDWFSRRVAYDAADIRGSEWEMGRKEGECFRVVDTSEAVPQQSRRI